MVADFAESETIDSTEKLLAFQPEIPEYASEFYNAFRLRVSHVGRARRRLTGTLVDTRVEFDMAAELRDFAFQEGAKFACDDVLFRLRNGYPAVCFCGEYGGHVVKFVDWITPLTVKEAIAFSTSGEELSFQRAIAGSFPNLFAVGLPFSKKTVVA